MTNTCVLYGYKTENECHGLSKDGFNEMKKTNKCGSDLCPFYKTERQQAYQEEACRQRLIDIDYLGKHYDGKYTGLVTGKR